MKAIKHVIVCILVSFLLLSCQSQKNNDYEAKYPLEISDDFKKVNVYPQEGKADSYTRYEYYPKKPMIMEGVPCERFTLNENGRLITYRLSEEYELNGSLLPAGTHYQERNWGADEKQDYILSLPEVTEMQGYQVLNKEYKGAQHHVDLYKNGQLNVFISAEDVEIDGILCKGGQRDCGIILDEDGSLKECTLAKNIEVSGQTFKAGERYVR
ncbi:hypothetical protein ACFLQX_02585 [Bacteroidota bacterium]